MTVDVGDSCSVRPAPVAPTHPLIDQEAGHEYCFFNPRASPGSIMPQHTAGEVF